mgnify:CR=1 FL=1|tara:strand:+ start:350 stop:1282 length:933 start_codon:yes stop_codon:yes gene_type:complete
MKLVMILLVRDEADIIQHNIEFHLHQGIDHIVAIDNGSVDGTRDILADYMRSGTVTVIDEPRHDFAQSTWVTRAAIIARDDLGADWIFINDADEFSMSSEGRLKSELAETDAHMLVCTRKNMVFPYNGTEDALWFERLVYRVDLPFKQSKIANIYTDELPCPYFYLDLPPKVIFRGTGLQSVAMGNHSARFSQKVRTAPARICIYHFPVRSAAQFEQKILQGGAAYLENKELPESVGWHWRRWYRMILEEGITAVISEALPSAERLQADLNCGSVVKDNTCRIKLCDLGLKEALLTNRSNNKPQLGLSDA